MAVVVEHVFCHWGCSLRDDFRINISLVLKGNSKFTFVKGMVLVSWTCSKDNFD